MEHIPGIETGKEPDGLANAAAANGNTDTSLGVESRNATMDATAGGPPAAKAAAIVALASPLASLLAFSTSITLCPCNDSRTGST
jgi:hypothetical protein